MTKKKLAYAEIVLKKRKGEAYEAGRRKEVRGAEENRVELGLLKVVYKEEFTSQPTETLIQYIYGVIISRKH